MPVHKRRYNYPKEHPFWGLSDYTMCGRYNDRHLFEMTDEWSRTTCKSCLKLRGREEENDIKKL